MQYQEFYQNRTKSGKYIKYILKGRKKDNQYT